MTHSANLHFFVPALTAFSVSAVLTPLVGRYALRLGVVAKPRPDRWAGRPVPLLGGIAIFASMVVGILFGCDQLPLPAVGLILGGLFLLVFGVFDDRFSFRPQTKLIAQILGACIVTGFGIGFKVRPVEYFNVLISIFWIVAIINAINLMDNMDGLAPGVSLVAAVFLFVQLAGSGLPYRAAIAAALAGSLAGFLIYNFPPARIFMGDAGSLSVGLVLAGLSLSNALFAEQKLGALSVFFGPALVLAVPLLDVLLVSLTRIMRGQPISQGGLDHSSHRLIMLGLSERKALLVFYTLAAVSGWVGSQLAQGARLRFSVFLVPLSWIPLGLFFAWLARIRIATEESASEGRLAVIVGWVFKRRMAEVVMDLGLAFVAFCLAYALRFDFHIESVYRAQIARAVPWVLGLTLVSLQGAGIYGGYWEHYGIRDVFRFAKASGTVVLLCIAVAVVVYRFEDFPRSVFPLYGLLLFLALLGVLSSFHIFDIVLVDRGPRRALILGIGPEALTACAFITAKEGKGAVAGFVDPNPEGSATKLNGLPIFRLAKLEALNGNCPHERIVMADTLLSEADRRIVSGLAVRTGKALQTFEIRCEDVEV